MRFNTIKYLFMGLYAAIVTAGLMLKYDGFHEIDDWIFGILYAASISVMFIPIREKKIGSCNRRVPTILPILPFTLVTALLVLTANFAPGEFFDDTAYARFTLRILDKTETFVFCLLGLRVVFLVPSIILLVKKDPEDVYARFVRPLLGASALNTICSMFLHSLVMKRGGCFVGAVSGAGVLFALTIFFWVLGPALFLYLIFLRRRYPKA